MPVRDTESFKLKKTFKIIKTINLALLNPPVKHVSKCPTDLSLKYLQGWQLNNLPMGLGEQDLNPSSSFQMLDPLCSLSLSLPSFLASLHCPRTHLCSSSHLPHQVVNDDVGQQP